MQKRRRVQAALEHEHNEQCEPLPTPSSASAPAPSPSVQSDGDDSAQVKRWDFYQLKIYYICGNYYRKNTHTKQILINHMLIFLF